MDGVWSSPPPLDTNDLLNLAVESMAAGPVGELLAGRVFGPSRVDPSRLVRQATLDRSIWDQPLSTYDREHIDDFGLPTTVLADITGRLAATLTSRLIMIGEHKLQELGEAMAKWRVGYGVEVNLPMLKHGLLRTKRHYDARVEVTDAA